jgi:hypothetical protein
MTFFSRLPSGSLKIGTVVALRFWTFISSSNQACLEHEKALFYSLQTDISNDVLHAPIRNHLTLALKRFVVLPLLLIINHAY